MRPSTLALHSRIAGVAGLVCALVLGAGPAGAIETDAFGIAPVERRAGEPGLPVDVHPGRSVTSQVRVWNKTDAPLTLALRVAPAEVTREGTPVLGGDPAPAGWVELESSVVHLGPGESRTVGVRVDAPASMPPGATAAVVARPSMEGGGYTAVLKEVGLVVRMSPGGPEGAPAAAGPEVDGVVPWLVGTAAFAALLAVALGVRRARRTHSTGRAHGAAVPAPAA